MVKKEPLDQLGLVQVLPTTSCAPLRKASGPSKPVFLVSGVKDKSGGLHFKELLFKTTCLQSIYPIVWHKANFVCCSYLAYTFCDNYFYLSETCVVVTRLGEL